MTHRIIPLLSATAISLAALSGAAWADEAKTETMGETGVEAEAGKVEADASANVKADATAETGKDMVPGAKNEERETLPGGDAEANASGGTAVEGDTAVTAESEADKVEASGEVTGSTSSAADADKVPGSEKKSDLEPKS